MNQSKQASLKIWIYQSGLTSERQPTFYPSNYKIHETPDGWAFVTEVTVDFSLPLGFDPVQVTIVALNAKLVKAREDFAKLTKETNEQIQQLLAIDYTPATTGSPE